MAKWDSLILYVSRQYINKFKKRKKQVSTRYKSCFEFEDEIVNINITTTFTKDFQYAFDIDAEVCLDQNACNSVNLHVTVRTNAFPLSYNLFIAEIKDVLRHEFEHIAQELNPNKNVNIHSIQGLEFHQEALTEFEKPAYIYGFYKHAKTRRISMHAIIHEWVESRILLFNTAEESENVKNEFVEYGRKLLPFAKW